jgi:hypothetical protein
MSYKSLIFYPTASAATISKTVAAEEGEVGGTQQHCRSIGGWLAGWLQV